MTLVTSIFCRFLFSMTPISSRAKSPTSVTRPLPTRTLFSLPTPGRSVYAGGEGDGTHLSKLRSGLQVVPGPCPPRPKEVHDDRSSEYRLHASVDTMDV